MSAQELARRRRIGQRIRQAREGAGISQTQLARKVGYTSANPISKVEAGLSGLDILRAKRICKALRMSLDDLSK